jgi:hypothetical protein
MNPSLFNNHDKLTGKSSVLGLDINKLQSSALANSKSFKVGESIDMSRDSLLLTEEKQKSDKKNKCCKLCTIYLPERCWRDLLIEYLDTKSQLVLCIEEDDSKDGFNKLTGNSVSKTWRT